MKRLLSISITFTGLLTFLIMAASIMLPHTAFGKKIGFFSFLIGIFLWLMAALLCCKLVQIIKRNP